MINKRNSFFNIPYTNIGAFELITDEREFIKSKIKDILKNKQLPKYPICIENSKILECQELNKKLTNKSYFELKDEDKNLFMGDLFFLTDEAFSYYIFEVILYFYQINFFNNIFIQYFIFNETNKKRFSLLSKEEFSVVILFLENIIDEIDYIIGNRNIYNSLNEAQKDELFHPLKDFEIDIKTSITHWKKYCKI